MLPAQLIAYLILATYKVFCAPPPEDEATEVRRQRILKAQAQIKAQAKKEQGGGRKRGSLEIRLNLAKGATPPPPPPRDDERRSLTLGNGPPSHMPV